ncbi:TetR family transcriptional regulator [Aliirhizobium cellulosilyticum]|uniref:TetR/AcrR family acrAB operon transcriptional repressor n=1 Tax=Aliirhizobium cellulosilyticum TaxID=393664 RepID=A0A7W6V103_9HYPH|nr:TetR family transcriptional regulator [Rhizobium cellulosilyticum]MBB4349914.1 TetR/AcrR family acrAB operon transcriptional repressor [Rhizobium cellulosilyticum]MBB4413093.1 TetR/AcrR family acrAB operon transcriptional repressor [Rhizobium cellulosilyticum]MBB4447970.1 TetR/AcrR family acrAB operon transcriptional repressor [Rhizobium cellulosilyticum]
MRRTKAEAAETRCSILAAAEKLFFEKGVATSTLDEIATAAGVTRGAIYWHFNSKSDLFLELYNAADLPRVNMADVDAPCDDGRDPLSLVEKMACDWLQVLAEDRHRQRLLSILLRTNFTEEFQPVMDELDKLDREHTGYLESILERAANDSRLAAAWTPHSASKTFKWLMKGICWDWLLYGQKFDLSKDGSDKVRRLLASFRSNTV